VKYRKVKKVWEVTKSSVTAQKGTAPRHKKRGTAFTNRDLAAIVHPLIVADPGTKLKSMRAYLRQYIRYSGIMRSGLMSRVRRASLLQIFGVPDQNIELLPVLQKVLNEAGHHLNYEAVHGPRMRTVILAAARDEHSKRAAALKLRQQEGGVLSAADILNFRAWDSPGRQTASNPKEEWIARNSALLSSVNDPEKKYVTRVYLSLSHARKSGEQLIGLFFADACHGKVHLGAYTLFLVLGFTSNFNIVALAYVWQMANESTESWTHAMKYLKHHYPWFFDKATLASDCEKGIGAAIDDIFKDNDGEMRQIYRLFH